MLLQLLNSYGPLYALMPKEARQEHLLKNYYFNCDCVPCHENWPLRDKLQSFEVNNYEFDKKIEP